MKRLAVLLFLLVCGSAWAQPFPAPGCPASGCTFSGPVTMNANGAGNFSIVDNQAAYNFVSGGERPRYWSNTLTVTGTQPGVEESNFFNLNLTVPGAKSSPNVTATISGGSVNTLAIATAGSGLPDGTYSLYFQGGGCAGVVGTATISGGSITLTGLSNGGSGCTSAPAVGVKIATVPGEAFNIVHPYGQLDAGVYVSNYGEAFESSNLNYGIMTTWEGHNAQYANATNGITGAFIGQRCAAMNANPIAGSFAQINCWYVPGQVSSPSTGSGGAVTATQSAGSVTLSIATVGSGYPNGTYTLTFSGGGCAVYPVGTFTVASGSISSTNLSVSGTGCTSNPTVSLYFGSLPTTDYAAQIVDQYSTFATAGNMVIGSIATQALNVDLSVYGRSTSGNEYVLFLKSNNGFNNLFYVTADGHVWIPSVVNANGPVCGTSNGAINSGVCYVVTSTKTSNYTVPTGVTGTHFDNVGAAGSVTFTLPAAAVGLNNCFSVYASQTLEVLANGTDQIALGASLTTAGNITSNVANSSVCLEAHGTGLWIVSSQTGTWVTH